MTTTNAQPERQAREFSALRLYFGGRLDHAARGSRIERHGNTNSKRHS